MQTMTEPCPECGTVRQGGERYCRSCRWDFDSLAHRYRGTQWSDVQAVSGQSAAVLARPRWQAGFGAVGRIVAFYIGLAIFAGASLWSIREGVVPDVALSADVVRLLVFVIPIVAGVVSQIIPGRIARGLGKSALLAFVGWIGVGAVMWFGGRLFLEGIGYLGGIVEHTLAAITGASIIRVALFPLSRPESGNR